MQDLHAVANIVAGPAEAGARKLEIRNSKDDPSGQGSKKIELLSSTAGTPGDRSTPVS
jgi:hypothetical protein